MEGMLSPADIAVLSSARNGNGDNGNSGFGNGEGAWWIIIFLIFAFLGWGRGGFGGNDGSGSNGGGSVMDAYVLNSDFATLQRLLSDGFNNLNNAVTTVNEGLCNGFYQEARLVDGVNQNIMNGNFALQTAVNGVSSAVENCCCKLQSDIANVNYNNAMGFNSIQNSICTSTRDIVDAQNNGTRAILDAITANRIEDKNAQIQAQQNQITALQLAASQAQQSQYLVEQLSPKCPIPAFLTCNPYTGQTYTNGYGYGSNCGCSCGNY